MPGELHVLIGSRAVIAAIEGGFPLSHTASLITDPKTVAELRLSYDALRDAALTPGESVAYIQRAMEASTTCTLPDPI